MKNKKILIGAFILTLLVSIFAVSAATVTIRPDGQGDFSHWTNTGCSSGSSEWQCVDEVTLNTADVLSTTTQGAPESFTFENTGLSASSTINHVTLYYNAQRSSSIRYQVEPLIVSNGNSYAGGVTNLTSSFVLYVKIYTTNPATGVAWTVAEVEALQAGLRASTGTNRGGVLAQMYAQVDYNISNTCNDTDGNTTTTFGSTSGYFNNNLYTNNDVCQGTETVTENTCSGNLSIATNVSCGTDGYVGVNFCSGGDVYRNYTNYTCSGGACGSTTNAVLQQDCASNQYCSAGACVFNESCVDTDGGNFKTIFGTISGFFNNAAYQNNDTCIDDSNIIEYFCSGTKINSTNVTCGTDAYIGIPVCSSGNVWQNFTDFLCGNGVCSNSTSFTLKQNCTVDQKICNFGQCVYNNTCFDGDGGNNILIASNVTGILNGTGYTHFDVCLNTSVVTEYICVGGSLGPEPFATNVACNATTTCSLGRCV